MFLFYNLAITVELKPPTLTLPLKGGGNKRFIIPHLLRDLYPGPPTYTTLRKQGRTTRSSLVRFAKFSMTEYCRASGTPPSLRGRVRVGGLNFEITVIPDLFRYLVVGTMCKPLSRHCVSPSTLGERVRRGSWLLSALLS